MRDLLTFRMGFGIVMAPPDTYPIQQAIASTGSVGDGPPQPASAPAPDEWMRRLGTLPLMYQPGERWMYNTGSDVLGVLIARASGQPLGAFLRERIFEPLGMKDTGFSVPAREARPAGDAATASIPKPARSTLYDGVARQRVEPAARLPVGRRRAGLDRRRLPRLRPDDARTRASTARERILSRPSSSS